jgi:hypothetical protein
MNKYISFWRICLCASGKIPFGLIIVSVYSSINATGVLAQNAIQKFGSCPSGYHQSSDYCLPNSDRSVFALPKVGSCPSGYHQSSDYCLANSNNSSHAIIKVGTCPSGYHQSGDYCLEN